MRGRSLKFSLGRRIHRTNPNVAEPSGSHLDSLTLMKISRDSLGLQSKAGSVVLGSLKLDMYITLLGPGHYCMKNKDNNIIKIK